MNTLLGPLRVRKASLYPTTTACKGLQGGGLGGQTTQVGRGACTHDECTSCSWRVTAPRDDHARGAACGGAPCKCRKARPGPHTWWFCMKSSAESQPSTPAR